MQKTVLITGASRGIGLATAKVFLENGWKVVGTSTSGKVDKQDSRFTVAQLDLSDESSIQKLADWVKGEGLKIDALINNAAINLDWPNKKIDMTKLRETLEVNLVGTIHLTELLIPFIMSPGKIVNISSRAGGLNENFGSYMPAYKISKVGLNMYTRTLSSRLKKKGIGVYSVDPGWVRTDMGGDDGMREAEDVGQELFDLVMSDKETGLFYKQGKVREW
jgi:NAD(P)-dependent dehydrogenase (short-subunit alcohol dehydrogenase family)